MEKKESSFLEKVKEDEKLLNDEKKNYANLCKQFAKFIVDNNCNEQGEEDE